MTDKHLTNAIPVPTIAPVPTAAPVPPSMPAIIRALGRGKSGFRDLSFDEAAFVMGAILNGTITQAQLGAFLMLMRVKEETAEELAGMVTACVDPLTATPSYPVDVNWPAYAGKKKQPSWYLLAARLLAQNGISIFIHGGGEHTQGRQYAIDVCRVLGIAVVSSLSEAQVELQRSNICYMALADISPALSAIIDMKAELGLRSPANTLVRHINPLQAGLTLQGMFHPAYMVLHHQTAILLGQDNNLVLKGDGGEFEVRPDSLTAVSIHDGVNSVHDSVNSDQHKIEPVLARRALRPKKAHLEPLLALWDRDEGDGYGQAAALQTAALIVSALRRVSLASAQTTIEQWWAQRH